MKSNTPKRRVVRAYIILGADGEINWLLHRPEIYGVKARAEESRIGKDKIVPVTISYQVPSKPKKK